MSHPFEIQLARIRETLLMMSSLADRTLSLAMRALTERDSRLSDAVEAEDSEIDKLEVFVDELVITYMATHGPIARDCRLMLGASKISSNLERIGDEATTIARRAHALNAEPALTALIDLPSMARLAQQMLHDAISAFVDGNASLAQAIVPRDKEVDAINKRVAKTLAELMMENPANVSRCLHLITISKAIERIADHATNIAEEVYFLYSGQDIRHEAELKK